MYPYTKPYGCDTIWVDDQPGFSGLLLHRRLFKQLLHLVSWKNRVYNIKQSLTQPLTKIIPYTLKKIAFTTSRASEIKVRAKETLFINLHSEKYIRILQMLKTQLKRNRKRNPSFYYSSLYLSSMTLPCSHDSCHLSVLYTFQTWPCDLALPLYFTFAHHFPNSELASFYFKYSLETHDSMCEH